MKRNYGLTVLLLTAILYFNLQAGGEILQEIENASETAYIEMIDSASVSPEVAQKNEEDLVDTDVIEDISSESVDKQDETVIEADTEATAETETAADDSESESDAGSETEAGAEPETEEPDPFATEPYAQSSLKDIEEYFTSNHELAEKSVEFSERALAIIAGSSEDRNFRRQCEFLTRAAGQNVYAPALALIIMPRLLEVSNLVVENSIKTLMNTFADELISEPLAREIRLSELGNHLDSQAELAKLLRQLAAQIADFCDKTELQNSRRHVQGQIPEFLRAANRDMVALLRQQQEQIVRLLNLFDQHLAFCQVNLDYFLVVSDHAPAVMQGSQIGRILRSCLDFSVSLRNYRAEYEAFAYRFSVLIKARLTDIEKLVGSNSHRNARIAAFTGKFPARDHDEMPESAFSAVEMLQQMLLQLDNMREQSNRLMRDESSSVNDADQIAPEIIEQLKSELSRHLDSASWPVKPLPKPTKTSDLEIENDLEPDSAADEDEDEDEEATPENETADSSTGLSSQ